MPDDDGLVYLSAFILNPRAVNAPLEAVKIMSGFSEEVATAVIQLEWPASEPLKDRGSPIVYECIE